jgi:lysophospholipase L1-like esterase
MSTGHVLMHCASVLVMAAVAMTVSDARAGEDGPLREGFAKLSKRSIFFGHQSVGANILDGLRDLAAEQGVAVTIVETPGPSRVVPGTWGHAYIADNGNPLLKLQSFARAFEPAGGGAVDIAAMKFCYVDFHQGVDAANLFERYQATLRELQARSPRTTFVHLTAPIATTQGTLKSLAKRMLGRETAEAQNARREAFNALMRKAYQGKEPLFDLARIESTAPDGRVVTAEWEGRTVPVLVGAYTDDGGHLNALGRRVVAKELVAFLAGLPVRSAAADPAGAR